MAGSAPIGILDFRLSDAAAVPFEIGRLETTHRIRTSTHPHRHSYYQIIWATGGAGVNAADFEEHPIRPEAIFLISPGQVHVIRVDLPLHGYMLLFTADFLTLEGPALTTTAIADLPFFRPGAPNPVLTPTDQESRRLRPIAEDLLAEFGESAAWRRDTYPAFRRLCRAAWEDVEADEAAPLANWYERVQKAGEAGLASAAG